MRIRSLLAVSALALLTAACGPPRHHGPYHGEPGRGGHHHWMSHDCGPGSCTYRGNCYSEGAARSNDGVCQSCNAGRWVAAEGCHEHGCGDHGCCHHGCMGKDGKGMPCKDMPCMKKRRP